VQVPERVAQGLEFLSLAINLISIVVSTGYYLSAHRAELRPQDEVD